MGLTPSQLEWNMKLWWPQAETMISYAKLFANSYEQVHLDRLKLVTDWTYSHLVDIEHGEWFGYSDRAGEVTHTFKGGAYKGCFHVPRALLLIDQALQVAIDTLSAKQQ